MRQSPLERPAMMAARCEILLSPGTVRLPEMCPAGLIEISLGEDITLLDLGFSVCFVRSEEPQGLLLDLHYQGVLQFLRVP